MYYTKTYSNEANPTGATIDNRFMPFRRPMKKNVKKISFFFYFYFSTTKKNIIFVWRPEIVAFLIFMPYSARYEFYVVRRRLSLY